MLHRELCFWEAMAHYYRAMYDFERMSFSYQRYRVIRRLIAEG